MKKIIYPQKTVKKTVIGVTAPSSGLEDKASTERFELVKKQHESNNISVLEGKCLRNHIGHVSASKEERVEDFHSMIKNSAINLIHPPWGGEIVIDVLELLDYELIKNNPKWVQGYSDISTLLLAITIMTGVSTAHGANFLDSLVGQDKLTANSRDFLKCSEGDEFIQHSSEKWQKEFVMYSDKVDALFIHTEKTEWKLLQGDSAEFSGRLIGGCIDTIKHLIGTPYGDVPKFASEYAGNDGLVLYLENCEQEPTEMFRSLMSMKYAGWFESLNGLVIGRNGGPDKEDFSYAESIKSALGATTFPVVLDADIGHKPPQMTLLNGCKATFKVNQGKAELVQKLI